MARPEQLARQLRVRLDAQVNPATRDLLGAWSRAYLLIRQDLVDAAVEAAERGPLSPADFRSGRLGDAMNAASLLLRQLSRSTGVTITSRLQDVVAGSAEVTASFVAASASAQGVQAVVATLAPETLDAIVRRTTQQIASRTIPLTQQAERALRDQLVRGVARGAGPRDVARLMLEQTRGVFGGGMARAVNLARTEMVDAHRATSMAVRQANGEYVTGWAWSAKLDDRTCPACWAMHGTEHPATETMRGHQSCRCVPVPVLAWDTPGEAVGGTAEAKFRALPREQQLRVMGPGRLQALEDGVGWDRLAQVRDNPGWRQGTYATPVRELTR